MATYSYLILTRNSSLASAFRLQLLASSDVQGSEIVTRVVGEKPSTDEVVLEFHRLADWLEECIGQVNDRAWPRMPVVVTDWDGGSAQDSSAWNALVGGGWVKVLALLILAFPEVQWRWAGLRQVECGKNTTQHSLAGGPSRQDETVDSALDWMSVHGLEDGWTDDARALKREGFLPWFDPTGLRWAVRRAFVATDRCPAPPEAVVLEDETGFALLHGYVAYRFRWRCHVARTYGHMHRLLGPKAGASKTSGHYALSIEDRYLNPPDEQPTELSDPAGRVRLLPGLKGIFKRLEITYNPETNDKDERTRVPAISKPVGGVFDLWHKIKSEGAVFDGGLMSLSWRSGKEDASDHAAPGRLIEVASRLLTRAKHLRGNEDVDSPVQSLLAAVLACDAGRLLDGLPPSAALEALALQHVSEVKAECQFSGLGYRLETGERLDEIEERCRAICQAFAATQRERALLGAGLDIVRQITLVFRNNNQFDEEQACLIRSRDLLRHFWESKRSYPKVPEAIERWGRLAWSETLLKYWNWLLKRWSHPFISLSVCILVIAVSFHVWHEGDRVETPLTASHFVTHSFCQHLGMSFTTFFSVQPISDCPSWLTGITMFLGYFHLALIISHLYQLSLRR
jgi:hypothetical protein